MGQRGCGPQENCRRQPACKQTSRLTSRKTTKGPQALETKAKTTLPLGLKTFIPPFFFFYPHPCHCKGLTALGGLSVSPRFQLERLERSQNWRRGVFWPNNLNTSSNLNPAPHLYPAGSTTQQEGGRTNLRRHQSRGVWKKQQKNKKKDPNGKLLQSSSEGPDISQARLDGIHHWACDSSIAFLMFVGTLSHRFALFAKDTSSAYSPPLTKREQMTKR